MALSEYEQLRLQRIQRNAERMKELGLDQNLFKKMKPIRKKRIVKVKRVKPGMERRSRRLASNKSKNDNLVMLDYYTKDGEERVLKQDDADGDYDYEEDDDLSEEESKPRSKSTMAINSDQWKLSKQDIESLSRSSADENFKLKFEEFLDYERPISAENKRRVMKQVNKLFAGEGIRYESARYGWPENCYFQKGTKITPMTDFVELMIEGHECEEKWGRDRGNGWLLAHPLKKLLLFQQFLLTNPDFLASKLRIKDYCGIV